MIRRRFIQAFLMLLCCLVAQFGALVVSLPSLGADREAKGPACCLAPDLAREVHPDTTTAPRVKRVPIFTQKLEDQTIFVKEPFRFTYQARDNERGQLNCELVEPPPRAKLRRERKGNQTHCKFEWIPREFGQYTITVAVHNRETDKRTETSAVLTVTFQNAPPRFTNTLQETTIQAGETLRFTYNAEDPNVSEGDVLTFALVNPPQGATINPQTGDFTWSSPTTMSGQLLIEVEVRDKAGARATTNTRVHFEGVVAGPPQFTRTLPSETTLEVGQRLAFTFEAEDPNEGTLTFDMRRQPRGSQFNPGTGAFSWTPTDSQVGAHDITVIVHDVTGLQRETRTRILVEPKEPTNLNPPHLINLDRQRHTDAGKPLRFTVEAEDADGDALTYSLVNSPRGAAIDPQSGQFRWTPDFGQAGVYEIPVRVSDGKFSDDGTIRVEVSGGDLSEGETNLAPYFVKVPPAELERRVGETVAFSYETIDPNPGDVLSYRLVAGPSSAVIDAATGEFRWVPGEEEIGAHRIVVEVRDEAGEADEVSTMLNVLPAVGLLPITPDRLLGAPWWMYLGGGFLLVGLILGLVFLRRAGWTTRSAGALTSGHKAAQNQGVSDHRKPGLASPKPDERRGAQQQDYRFPDTEDVEAGAKDSDVSYSLIALPPGTLLDDQYIVERVLGHPGGFGLTYLVRDTRLETRVAIKEYLPRMLAGRIAAGVRVVPHSTRDAEPFRYGLEQFLNEARTLARFDHPNVIRVRNFFEANGTAYLVMDYYEGMSLAAYLEQQGGRLPERTALKLILPILNGLREVHAEGFLHRDIKPNNIYLAKTRYGGVRPILLDFGAAREAIAGQSRSLTSIITPGYAPFEQYDRRSQHGPWTDIYAAGATLYRMVTGQVPLEAPGRIREDDLEPPIAIAGEISPVLSDAVMQALAVRPEHRFYSAEAFQQVLLQLADPSQGQRG